MDQMHIQQGVGRKYATHPPKQARLLLETATVRWINAAVYLSVFYVNVIPTQDNEKAPLTWIGWNLNGVWEITHATHPLK